MAPILSHRAEFGAARGRDIAVAVTKQRSTKARWQMPGC